MTLDKDTRDYLTVVLGAWGATPAQVADTLEDATFGPGLTALQSTEPTLSPGVAIMVDEHEDHDLAALFALRERLDDEAFAAIWEIRPSPRVCTLLDPTGPQALMRYSITINRPQRVDRHFLLLAHAMPMLIAMLGEPGTNVWLIPTALAKSEAHRTGPTSAYDVMSRCVPVGTVTARVAGIDKALAHVLAGPA